MRSSVRGGYPALFSALSGVISGIIFVGIGIGLARHASMSTAQARMVHGLAAIAMMFLFVLISKQLQGAGSRLPLIGGWIALLSLMLGVLNSLLPVLEASPDAVLGSGDPWWGSFEMAALGYFFVAIGLYIGILLLGLALVWNSKWPKSVGAGHLLAAIPPLFFVGLPLLADAFPRPLHRAVQATVGQLFGGVVQQLSVVILGVGILMSAIGVWKAKANETQ